MILGGHEESSREEWGNGDRLSHKKFAEYRLIETFTEYLLIEPERIEAEVHRKSPDGGWTCATFTAVEDAIELESIGVTLRLGDLYAKVEFPAG